jgi:hypothetical protein
MSTSWETKIKYTEHLNNVYYDEYSTLREELAVLVDLINQVDYPESKESAMMLIAEEKDERASLLDKRMFVNEQLLRYYKSSLECDNMCKTKH